MRILMLEGHGACSVYRRGWANAMRACGYEVAVYNPDKIPTLRAFDEVNPDKVWLGTWEIDRPMMKALMARPTVQPILWADHWGDFDSEIDWKTDTVGRATKEQKEDVEKIVKSRVDIGKMSFVYTYYSQRWVDRTHNKWSEVGLKPFGLPLAADVLACPFSRPVDWLKCDVAFAGGWWEAKSTHLRKYLLPLCNGGIKVKIFGGGDWPVVQRLGMISDQNLPLMYASATVSPCIYEPLATKYGFDVSERVFKCLSSGGFPISEDVESLTKDFFPPNHIVTAANPSDMEELIHHAIKDPELRIEDQKRGADDVYEKHTYFHRLAHIAHIHDDDAERVRILKIYQPLLDHYYKSTVDYYSNCGWPHE